MKITDQIYAWLVVTIFFAAMLYNMGQENGLWK